jgi:hypothetical protein
MSRDKCDAGRKSAPSEIASTCRDGGRTTNVARVTRTTVIREMFINYFNKIILPSSIPTLLIFCIGCTSGNTTAFCASTVITPVDD